ncbi:MAG TPA: phospholipase D-like domain-containing protein [Gemmatimonadaceae bacterium]|nr:phospholipase D-like domain-containing protein [Gemmatimonadaceae bacterium]
MSSATLDLLIGAVHLVLAIGASVHIVLKKRDPRAAIGWIGLVWLTPIIGSASYVFLGVNRIRRRAGELRRDRLEPGMSPTGSHRMLASRALPADVPEALHPLATLAGNITRAPLTAGNAVDALLDGDEGYPAMLDAVAAAQQSVALATYIFDRGQVADRFLAALEAAVKRGVEVRVLIDGVGARYSRPSIVRALRERGITTREFLPSLVPIFHPYFNLRNHRKLLVVDGKVGFCGGLNIRDGCQLSLNPPNPTQDVHFRFQGPVVHQLMSAFAFDWKFTTAESLEGDRWFPALESDGPVAARGIPDGPDEDFEALLFTFIGAIAVARRRVRVVTPYFLPDRPLIDALQVAALRGVDVQIVLPSRVNLRTVQWAMYAQLGQVLRGGCKVFLTPPPFDHSKLFTVDGEWTIVGSSNWDPRSLRLNFEYMVECYDADLTRRVDAIIDRKLATSRSYTMVDHRRRHIPVRLRDGLVWLAQPYL